MDTGTLSDRVYEVLRERILGGEFPPGSKLNLTHLARDLEVSNTPLREAVARLERVGLIEVVPYSGPRVLALTPQQVSDIFDVRIVLEELAVRLVAERATEDAYAKLRQAIAAQERALEARDRAAYNAADRSFHEILVMASGNSVLLETLPILSDRILLLLESYDPERRLNHIAMEQHRELLAALEARDATAAVTSLHRQLEGGRRALISYMECYHNRTGLDG